MCMTVRYHGNTDFFNAKLIWLRKYVDRDNENIEKGSTPLVMVNYTFALVCIMLETTHVFGWCLRLLNPYFQVNITICLEVLHH